MDMKQWKEAIEPLRAQPRVLAAVQRSIARQQEYEYGEGPEGAWIEWRTDYDGSLRGWAVVTWNTERWRAEQGLA